MGVRGVQDDGTTLTIASLDGPMVSFRRVGAPRGRIERTDRDRLASVVPAAGSRTAR